MKVVNAPQCGREDALVAFLYGELNEDESQIFRRHLQECNSCSDELAQFQDVRESVVAWRNESIGVLSAAPAPVALSETTMEKRSAVSALRQFFNLSPLWMKGAVAFASILFCLFAALAIARLRETPPRVIVVDRNAPTADQLNAEMQKQVQSEVDRRVKEEIERRKNAEEPRPSSTSVSDKVAPNSRRQIPNQASVASNPTPKARRPLSKVEREQLAADLRLITAVNEAELDLLDDGINQ